MRFWTNSGFVKFAVLLVFLLVVCEITSARKPNKPTKKPGKGHGRRHAYKKFTKKSNAIGEASNENLQTLQTLMSDGTEFKRAVSTLTAALPESCTATTKNCDVSTPYRTIDGTCNNLRNPFWGAAFTFFDRITPDHGLTLYRVFSHKVFLTPAAYSDGYNAPRGGFQSTLPNARKISTTIHPDLILPDLTLTNMIPQVGQFVDHDLTLAPEADLECCTTQRNDIDCLRIEIPADDPFYSSPNVSQTCLPFTRSTPFCYPINGGIREQMNSLTAFLDASQVYGSDATRERQLRAFEGGRLRVSLDNPNFLPTVHEIESAGLGEVEIMGTFAAGDERVNEMPALTVLHTLLVREHNRLAREIESIRPSMSDEQIYQATRRLLIAEWQKVVYGEYLPIILGSTVMARYDLSIFPVQLTRYSPTTNPTIFHSFATAAYRFGHTLINGIIRMMRDIVEVNSYRIRDGFFNDEQIKSFNGEGYDLILGGLMQQNAQNYDRFVTEDLANFVLRKPEDSFGSDLLARNIQRGRDHGLNNYNTYRKFCNLPSLTTWAAVPAEIPQDTWQKFQSLYNSPLDIDLFPGGLSELPLAGAVTGPTFNCLKAVQFQKTKFGDRFFFTHGGEAGSFTLDQVNKIAARTLGDIICQNSNIQRTPANVFRPVSPSNPWIQCNDNVNRKFLNVADFV